MSRIDRKNEIIEAALKTFSKKGYSMSLSELSKLVGIKKPSLYNHFDSKDDILLNSLTKEIEDYFSYYLNKINEYEDQNCKSRYKGVFMSLIDYFMNDEKLLIWRKIPLIPNSQLRKALKKTILEKESHCNERISNWFVLCMNMGHFEYLEVEGVILLYFAMIQGVLEIILFSDDKSEAKTIANNVFETFFEAIRK